MIGLLDVAPLAGLELATHAIPSKEDSPLLYQLS